MWQTADKYTLIVPYDRLLTANDVTNNSRVCSLAGVDSSPNSAQKLVNLSSPRSKSILLWELNQE